MPRPIANPPNPWESTHVEWIGPAPPARLEVFEEPAKSILAENDSPDVGFRYSLNPYRGCLHACAYCYARPAHQYLGFGAGTDFDRKIVVKVNAPERLRERFRRRSWAGELIAFSGDTDCYQPLEASYELTKRCLEVCLEYRNPVAVITKSRLVQRDVDTLSKLARDAHARVSISIPFARDDLARKIEPWASPPSKRFETIRVLADAGVPTGVAVAPIIPGLTESDIPEILERARDAGASQAFMILLRLPAEVLPVFRQRIVEVLPEERVRRIERAVSELRGGKMNDSQFFSRQSGQGERWRAIEALFDSSCQRLGLEPRTVAPTSRSTFRRPSKQLSLWNA